MAGQAGSPEMRDGFMRLAVLYEELAEYAAKPGLSAADVSARLRLAALISG